MLEMLTIRPQRARSMPRSAARQSVNAAVRSTAITSRVRPALLTRMSTLPSASAARATSPAAAAVSPRSAARRAVLAPSASASAPTSRAAASEAPYAMATAAPSAARRSATARPMPREAPVTRATLPSNRRSATGHPRQRVTELGGARGARHLQRAQAGDDPPREAAEHRSRAHLDQGLGAEADEGGDTVAPAHRRGQLAAQPVPDGSGVADRGAVDVARHRHRRGHERRGVDEPPHLLGGAG